MRHRVEVDQSIKIEDTGATVLAFANGIAAAVIIPGPVKRAALNALLLRGKSRQTARLMLFAAGLALLLRDRQGKDRGFRKLKEEEVLALLRQT